MTTTPFRIDLMFDCIGMNRFTSPNKTPITINVMTTWISGISYSLFGSLTVIENRKEPRSVWACFPALSSFVANSHLATRQLRLGDMPVPQLAKYNPKSGKFPRDWNCFHPSRYERTMIEGEKFGGFPHLCHRNPRV
jgi:hypothetical protein